MISNGIYKLASTMNGPDVNDKDVGLCLVKNDAYVGTEDHARVRRAMNHFVKDWSEEERRERCQTFEPVLDALKIFEGEVSGRRRKKILVPGAGLGRLAWEISQLGLFAHCLYALR